jgi:hypothetical protein
MNKINTPRTLVKGYYPPTYGNDLPMSMYYMDMWDRLDIDVHCAVENGILGRWIYDFCLVSFIGTPTCAEAVLEANRRYRIECAVRGIDF